MEQVYKIDLPTTAVRDLEVLNKEQVFTLVETFLTTNGITGGSGIMVLSPSLLFEKQIVQDLSDEIRRSAAIKEYTDNVPFEQTAYVSYPIQTGIGVIATNEEFFGTVKRAFERKNVNINLIVPIQAFGDVKVTFQTGPDVQTADFFLQNADQVKQFAFHVSVPPILKKPDAGKKLVITNGPSKKLPIYLSVFGFLILVLVIMIVMANQPPANKPVATTAAAEEPAAAINPPTPVAEQPVGSGSAEFNRAALNIQIKTPALFKPRIDEIKGRMTSAGYVIVDVIEAPAAAATVVYLDRTKVSAAQRDALLGELRTYLSEFSVQDVEQAQYAIQIVIGKEL